jgi:heptaprenyl diphosphate synthase
MSLLTSLALILFVIELRVPNIVEGVKLGLANIVTVYAVYRYSAKETAMIVFARVFLGSLFGGGISAMIYSLSGAFLCLVGMIGLRKIIPINYIWLSSVIGAMLHNIGQIAAAVVMTKSVAIVGYLPLLLVTGSIAGLFTGMSAQLIIKRKSCISGKTGK